MMIECHDGVYVSRRFVAKLRPRDFGETDLIGANGELLGTLSVCTANVAMMMGGVIGRPIVYAKKE
jgi:hypothetical protein